MIIGVMLLCTMQALGELAVLYPINGAFFSYTYRFVDKSWGFAMGWWACFFLFLDDKPLTCEQELCLGVAHCTTI